MRAPLVIFKFDDYTGATRGARKLDWFLRRFRVKVTWGIIGSSLKDWTPSDESWFHRALDSGLYRFWNHGWTHEIDEFRPLTCEQAVEHLQKTQAEARNRLGLELDTFGAPCNAKNNETVKAIERVPELKYWYYGDERFRGVNFKRIVGLEYPIFHPSFIECIRAHRRLSKDVDVVVVQGHPNVWTGWDRLNFYLATLYLKWRGSRFAFPDECVPECKKGKS